MSGAAVRAGAPAPGIRGAGTEALRQRAARGGRPREWNLAAARPTPDENGPRRLRAAVAAPAHLWGGGSGRWHLGVRSHSGGTAATEPRVPRGGAWPRLQVFPRPVAADVRRHREGSPGLAGVAGSEPPLELRKAAAAALPERGPSAAGPGRALPRRCRPVGLVLLGFRTARSGAPRRAEFAARYPRLLAVP